MEAKSEIEQLLTDTYFSGVHDRDLHACVSHLLSYVYTEHRAFPSGPLRQLLLSASLDPSKPKETPEWYGGRGVLRLHLANGFLYELHLRGNIEYAINRVHTIAEWLAGQAYDLDQFEHYDASLSQLIDSGRAGEGTCAVQLARRATLAPPPGIRPQATLKTAFAAFNLLRKDYGLPPLDASPKLLVDHLASAISSTRGAVEDYLGGLNRGILEVVQQFSKTCHRRYDELMVYNFLVAGSAQSSRNRLQAVYELPWLLGILSGMDKIRSYGSDPLPIERRISAHATAAIIEAIDTGKPLFASVANAFNVPKETIRWTRRRMLPFLGQFTGPRMDLLLTMLSWLPREKRPETEVHWRAMRDVIYALLTVCTPDRDNFASTGVLATEPRYRIVLARWVRKLARLSVCTAAQRIERLRQAGNGPDELNDYIDALRRSLRRFLNDAELPEDGAADAYQRILLEWLASQPFHRVVAMSRRWHESMLAFAQQQQRRLSSAANPRQVRWPPVLREPVYVRSLAIIELTDSDSLIEEGVAMNHCVGGYSARCVLEESLIVSIRDMGGQRLSTAELAIQWEQARIFVRQHKGKKNSPASADCELAIAELLTLLNGSEYQESLALRREFDAAQCRTFEALMKQQELDIEHYRRAEEHTAWLYAFGEPPAEKSLPLSAVFQEQQ